MKRIRPMEKIHPADVHGTVEAEISRGGLATYRVRYSAPFETIWCTASVPGISDLFPNTQFENFEDAHLASYIGGYFLHEQNGQTVVDCVKMFERLACIKAILYAEDIP